MDEFDLSRDGKTIAFVTNEDGFGVLHLFDTGSRKEKPVPGLPKGVISGVRWHKIIAIWDSVCRRRAPVRTFIRLT